AEASARVARDNELRVRQYAYVADMRVAQQLRQEGDLASLGPLIDRYSSQGARQPAIGVDLPIEQSTAAPAASRADPTPAAPMPFEWRYLDRFRHAVRFTIEAHQGPIDLLAFAASGNVLATSGSRDGRVCLWSIPTGQLLAAFAVRTNPAPRYEE